MRGGAHADIVALFADVTERAARGECDAWATTPRGRLALVVVLDQFSRSVWADSPRAFAQAHRNRVLRRVSTPEKIAYLARAAEDRSRPVGVGLPHGCAA